MEKLDSFSKILLATQSINYMANTINSVNEQIKMSQASIPSHLYLKDVIGSGITNRDNVLYIAEKKLVKIMEELGDFMNSHDIGTEIDSRITKEAFSILHGNDSVD